MANICNFEMRIRGKHADIEKFHKAITQDGTTWMGRGAEADIEWLDDNYAAISGRCKWSLYTALVSNAVSMRETPELWFQLDTSFEYITMFEACKKWNLSMEAYSKEPGCCFQEHYIIINGEVTTDDYTEWHEVWLDNYDSKEEAENALGINISEDEWESGEPLGIGGYAWDFSI